MLQILLFIDKLKDINDTFPKHFCEFLLELFGFGVKIDTVIV